MGGECRAGHALPAVVKLLFDENLSRRLASSLSDLYPGSTHVNLVGLQKASDAEIWRYASEHRFAIVSKDSDFRHRAASNRGARAILIDTGGIRERCVLQHTGLPQSP